MGLISYGLFIARTNIHKEINVNFPIQRIGSCIRQVDIEIMISMSDYIPQKMVDIIIYTFPDRRNKNVSKWVLNVLIIPESTMNLLLIR